MTEQEWLECTDPQKMLAFLRGKASDRTLRLFACACCRRIWHSLTDERSRRAVEVAEQFADGAATDEELDAAGAAAEAAMYHAAAAVYAVGDAGNVAMLAADAAIGAARRAAGGAHLAARSAAALAGEHAMAAKKAQCELLRDISSNPFRPSPALPSAALAWSGGTVRRIAQAIYDDRAFDRLPVLADALEEAGCTDSELLGHCRGPGPHCRGCWAVDALLGKS
jgi:hypothetical protein